MRSRVRGGGEIVEFVVQKAGKLTLAARRIGKLSVVAAKRPLPAAPVEVKVTLSKQGGVTLTANKSLLASAQIDGPLTAQPTDGLQVTRDTNGTVGDFEAPFIGNVERVVIERDN